MGQAAPIGQAGQLVADRQLLEAQGQLGHPGLGVHLGGDVAKDEAAPLHAVGADEVVGVHLDLDHGAVAAAHPGRARHLPGAMGDFVAQDPAGVVGIPDAVAPAAQDLLFGHAQDGAGGRIGGQDPTLVGVGEDDALGVQLEHGAERGQARLAVELVLGHLHLPSDSKMA